MEPRIAIYLVLATILSGLFAYAFRQIHANQRAARTFRAIAESASDGLVLMERDGTVIWVNDAYCQIMGRDAEEMLGRYGLEFALPPEDAMAPEDVAAFRFDPTEERFSKLTQRTNMRGDGTRFIHEFSHAVVQDGSHTRYLVAGRDITERLERETALIAAQEGLEQLANVDTLTGLENRARLWATLEALIAKGDPFAVLQIDMNDFKAINDTYGHIAGDNILRHFADILRGLAQDSWTVARAGGDEFTLLIPGITDLSTALDLARQLRKAARKPMPWQSGEIQASISVGAVLAAGDIDAADEILNRGDVALYTAKHQKPDRVAGYDTALHRSFVQQQQMQREVAKAIEEDAFTFHFQPIVDTYSHRVVRFEMLARWEHPERGMIPPGEFLPHVERLGLISELDFMVIEHAAESLRVLDEAGLQDVGISINLSTGAMRNATIPDELIARTAQASFMPSRLSIEVLETTVVTLASNDAVARQLERLRAAGFTLLLDDFGIGHAGLAHLASLAVHGIKIDRQLTSAVDRDEKAHHVVTATIDLAGKLGVDVVAEGAETAEQITTIMAAGGRCFQGYGIARPMPLEAAIVWAGEPWANWSATRPDSQMAG
ncbi:EAL domain-containing protein [uncultured Tateyamaria sp.]|uniref:putative bifunctional diguanylate cyclase/phosphodiesterase n=1 Tax=Tateyamaria sp. 1078 TaxID=3417464 RepID=UPI0026285C1B|nr:EAL domain-containing protein [uncultured Tateyamaria sp.]